MIWQALHLLFGWDYVAWRNSADQGVARVRRDGMGRAYYFRYKSTELVDLVADPKHVVWLTCAPEKYMQTGGGQ